MYERIFPRLDNSRLYHSEKLQNSCRKRNPSGLQFNFPLTSSWPWSAPERCDLLPFGASKFPRKEATLPSTKDVLTQFKAHILSSPNCMEHVKFVQFFLPNKQGQKGVTFLEVIKKRGIQLICMFICFIQGRMTLERLYERIWVFARDEKVILLSASEIIFLSTRNWSRFSTCPNMSCRIVLLNWRTFL